MVKHIVSVDAGNGGVNAVKLNPKNNHYVSFPSIRNRVSGQTLDLDDSGLSLLEYDWADFEGSRWTYGDDALMFNRSTMDSHRGAYRYGDEVHRFLVAVACSKLNVTSGVVDLVLFVPPGMYKRNKPILKNAFTGTCSIQFKNEDKPREWQWGDVKVLPEGLGAITCFAINANGKRIKDSSTLDGEIVVLDIGMHTLDAMPLVNGNFNADEVEKATFEDSGIMNNILKPALEYIKKNSTSDDFQVLTVYDIDAVLRAGMSVNDWNLTIGNQNFDTKRLFENLFARFAQWIKNNVFDARFDGMRGYKAAVIFGGGARMVDNHLIQIYGEKILQFDNVDPLFANAEGGIRLAKHHGA
ncbi:MAG: ParM/StbA family protein [Chloroflexota bacterium]